MQLRPSESGLVTMVSASVPTRISVYSMPFSSQSCTSSSAIGRDALEMSVEPSPQNRSNPPPVPEIPTLTCTSGASLAYSSAMASVSGPTVDEPSISMLPDTSSPPPESPDASDSPAESPPDASEAGASSWALSSPPQAVNSSARTASKLAINRQFTRMLLLSPSSSR
jgi:hypothetical protein